MLIFERSCIRIRVPLAHAGFAYRLRVSRISFCPLRDYLRGLGADVRLSRLIERRLSCATVDWQPRQVPFAGIRHGVDIVHDLEGGSRFRKNDERGNSSSARHARSAAKRPGLPVASFRPQTGVFKRVYKGLSFAVRVVLGRRTGS